jgi:hypothetical protein
MNRLWRIVLPLIGFIIFALITYQSVIESRQLNKQAGLNNSHGRYFWWSSIRLDSDPLDKRALSAMPVCRENSEGSEHCEVLEPLGIWIDPSWLVEGLILTALPAFLLGIGLVGGLGRIGFSQVWTFMISMPPLISAWFYFIGWLLDRRRMKRYKPM